MFVELQQARSFLAVARGGGYARAAAALHRSQPAVTASVKALERALGRPLFERRGRSASLTAAGRALAEDLGPLVDRWEQTPDRLSEKLEGAPRGELRIGAGELTMLYVLPRTLAGFRRRHPEVRVILRHQSAEETLRLLKAGELDFGLRSVGSVPNWAEFRPLASYDRLAICAPRHSFARGKGPVTLARMAEHPLLFPGSRSITRILVESALSRAGLEYSVGLEAAGWEAVKTYAAAGFGVAVVPALCLTAADRRRLAARDVSALFGRESHGLVLRRGAPLSAAANAAIALLSPRETRPTQPRTP